MDQEISELWLNTGIHVAQILSTYADNSLVFEHVGYYLINALKKVQVTDISIYIKDETKDTFRCEVLCDDISIRQGFDSIPLIQVQNAMKNGKDICQTTLRESFYRVVAPLKHGDMLLGLLEFHSYRPLDDGQKHYFMTFCSVFALGIQHYILSKRSQRDKQSIDMVTEMARHLNSLTSIEDITASFARITVKHMRFDRATIFLFDENQNPSHVYCADSNGEEYPLETYPHLPDTEDILPLHPISGYWIPLKANTRKVGMALFDNIYSAYPFPTWNLDILSSLCHQFATAVENIHLFRNLQITARHDKLTQLYNRAFFEETLLDAYIKGCVPLSIIIGDVNGLKVTNDVFGHLEGDRLLIRIAGLIRQACSPEHIIARWGGDEIIILMPEADEAKAMALCESIDMACKKADYTIVQTSISLGYATKSREDEDLLLILKKAEDRMYANKQIDHENFKRNFLEALLNYLHENCLETLEHLENIKVLAMKFGNILGLSDYERENLLWAAVFHDVGKVIIDPHLLKKPEPLTPEEWETLKKHPVIGSRIVQSSLSLSNIFEEVLYHHEHWDGNGYPHGKKAYEIPKLARILAIVDAYDVMTHDRPYKKAISHNEALATLKAMSGSQFDPFLVKAFCLSFEKGLDLPTYHT